MRKIQSGNIINMWMVIVLLVFVISLDGCNHSNSRTKNHTASSSEEEVAEAATESAITLPETQKIYLSQTLDLGAELRSAGQEYQVTSADETIVKVLEDGSVFGVAQGETTVNVTVGETTCQTMVKVRKRGMVYPTFRMMQGETLDIQFSSEAKPTDYTWTSTDDKIAKVTKAGKIKAKGIGFAVVTGTSDVGTVRCEVTVTEKIDKAIYLTFDDGPNRYTTPKILNILKKNDVKATFFELKPAKNDFDLTERIIEEGHTLAIHGYKHKYEEIYVSEKTYHENLDKLRDLFFKKFGVWCTLTRFPGGSSNLVSSYNPGIMTKLTAELDDWGYHYFDWNVSSGDAGGANNAKEVYRNFKQQLSTSHASVVLMHDFYKNDKTINALDRIIKYGKKHGYTFLPLTASTEEVHHVVNN